jgi:serine/threonine protein kinase
MGEMEIKKRGFLSRMTEKKERKRAFLENGSKVLEELVRACNGRPIPIRTFSYQELSRATNGFDPCLVVNNETLYNWYTGSFDDRTIFIKEYKEDAAVPDMAFTDIAVSAKASAHKNVIKLVGCCLETQIPTLIYESAENGTLSDRIFAFDSNGAQQQRQPMAWQSRLKIARQIAHAIAYLHTAFSRPIIHRHIKSRNIFLDRHDVPKLCDFSLSVSVPEGETDVKVELREYTIGYVCPIYFATSRVTEKTDVYSFGRVLLDLLTGRSAWQLNKDVEDMNFLDYLRNRAMNLNQVVDPAILAEEGGANVQQQLQAVLQLAIISVDYDPVKRPTMVYVTKELRRIEKFIA